MHSLSFSYPEVDETTRAELATRLATRPGVDNAFILSTCLRIEVFVAGDETRLSQVARSLFDDIPEAKSGKVRSGDEAVLNLFRIASGLESPILGEAEILTQFRQAVKKGLDGGHVTGHFESVLTRAISVGRKAREMLPESPHDSLAAVAAQAVGAHDRVAVFGWGVMARSVVHALQGLPAPVDVTVVARRPEKVDAPGVDVRHFDSAPDVLATFPAVISATSAKHRPVADDVIARSLSGRTGRLTLVDMAMPPDFQPPTDATVEYLNIDDLARMADRRPRSEGADGYVEAAAADAYRKYAVSSEVGPVIGAMMSRADEVVESVVERFSGRLEDPSDVETLRQAAHTVARRLMAQPVEMAKQGESLETIASLFLDDRE